MRMIQASFIDMGGEGAAAAVAVEVLQVHSRIFSG